MTNRSSELWLCGLLFAGPFGSIATGNRQSKPVRSKQQDTGKKRARLSRERLAKDQIVKQPPARDAMTRHFEQDPSAVLPTRLSLCRRTCQPKPEALLFCLAGYEQAGQKSFTRNWSRYHPPPATALSGHPQEDPFLLRHLERQNPSILLTKGHPTLLDPEREYRSATAHRRREQPCMGWHVRHPTLVKKRQVPRSLQ